MRQRNFSNVDLMLLGALMDHPMNAYELKKRMETANVKAWVKISSPAVYKNLVRLHRRGLLDAEVVREGEMPEKTIYTVNEKGRQHFQRIMEEYSENPGSEYIDFTAFLCNLRRLDGASAEKMMGQFRNQLYAKKKYMELVFRQEADKSKEARAIVGLYVKMYDLFYQWACNFDLRQEKG